MRKGFDELRVASLVERRAMKGVWVSDMAFTFNFFDPRGLFSLTFGEDGEIVNDVFVCPLLQLCPRCAAVCAAQAAGGPVTK